MTYPPVLAHPLTQQAELPVSPLVLALAAVYVLLTVTWAAGRWGRSDAVDHDGKGATEPDEAPPTTIAGRAAFWAARAVGLALFVVTILAAWRGDPSQVRNIAPALTMGAGWPVITLGAILLGRVWWWLNPYDTLARAIAPLGAGDGSARAADGAWAPVWWAIAPAAVWMVWLTVWPDALEPRSIGIALVLYTMVTMAGCLALGRRAWLWRAEFFTVFFGLLAAVRRRGAGWTPPAGAAALLGVVCGGALFGLVRDSDLGLFFAYGTRADLYSRLGVVAFMAIAGLLAQRAARRAVPGSVAVGIAPLAALVVVALAVGRNRLTTSLQLLPILAPNPLGGETALFATGWSTLNPRPLGEVGPVWLQVALLLIGALAGVLLARRFAAHRETGGFLLRRTTGVVSGVLGSVLAIGVAAAAAI